MFCGEDVNGLDGVNQLVVLDSLRDEVLHGVHEGVGGGHLGVEKTVAKLKERFYWPSHYSDELVCYLWQLCCT